MIFRRCARLCGCVALMAAAGCGKLLGVSFSDGTLDPIPCVTPGAACPTECQSDPTVDLQSNADHCGSCETRCPEVAGAERTCAAARCGFRCRSGHHVCRDHCVGDDVNLCGPACAPCPVPKWGKATCSDDGQCGV